jgi:DNA-directed RNA polymerase beta subunit
MNTTATSSNGKKQPVVPPQQTPEELAVATAVQHHVSSYQRLVTERDELQKVVDRQEQMLTVARIEIEGLRAELAAAQSRIASYQHDRDDAVANLGVYQTLFISFLAQMRAFGIEHAPLIKETNAPAS